MLGIDTATADTAVAVAMARVGVERAEARSRRTVAPAAVLLAEVEACVGRGRRVGAGGADRGRRRAGVLHRACGSASRPRGRWHRRAGFPGGGRHARGAGGRRSASERPRTAARCAARRAPRRGLRGPLRPRERSSGSRSSPLPGELAERARSTSPAGGGDGSLRFREELEAAGAEVLPGRGSRAPGSGAPHLRVGAVAGSGPADRSPIYLRDQTQRWIEQRDATPRRAEPAGGLRGRAPRLQRPAGRDLDRASLVPDAVVAGDVRPRALEAVGICLAAEDDEGLIGYLVCSRYEDVWHLMNVAVRPTVAGRGSRGI